MGEAKKRKKRAAHEGCDDLAGTGIGFVNHAGVVASSVLELKTIRRAERNA